MNGMAHLEGLSSPQEIENSRHYLLLRTDIYRKQSFGAPVISNNAIVCRNPGTCVRTPSVYSPIVSDRGYGSQEGVHRVVVVNVRALTVDCY